MLQIFYLSMPCILYCNTSLQGINAILKLRADDGTEHSIVQYPRKLVKHEINYATTELKCLAIVNAVKMVLLPSWEGSHGCN